MSSVSSAGSDYPYYQQQVSDLEDQNAKDRKKAKEREDDRVSDLEQKYQTRIREGDEDANRAITRAKETSNSALSSEREDNKNEMERLKRDTYDRYGRVARNDSTEYRQKLDELQNQLDRTKKRDEQSMNKTRDAYSAELERRDRLSQEDTSRAVQDTRDKLHDQQESSSGNARQEYRNMKDESSKRYAALDRDRMAELSDERRRSSGALDEAQRDYSRRLDRVQEAYDKKTERQDKQLRDSLTAHADRLRTAHERETRELRDRMGDLIEGEKQYVKSGQQGRADAIADYENDWRRRLETQGGAYQRQVSDLKAQNDRTESSLSHQNYQNMKDRDVFMANTMKAQTQKHHREMQELQDAYLKDHQQMEKERQSDQATQQQVLEARMTEDSAQNQRALGNQAKNYRASMLLQRQADRQELAQAEASLHEQRTSADTALISPAAEAKMRKQIAGQYEKNAQADLARKQREADSMRDNYRQRFQELADSERNRNMKLSRQIASERDGDRATFTTHVTDLEEMNANALRRKDESNAHDTDKLTKDYTRLMSHQNMEHEEQLDEVRGSAVSKIDELRDQTEFDRKMSIRANNNKQNQMAHDYEKKLSEQKTGYEDQLADQKASFASISREKERNYRNTLDQQSRAYEHRLAQQDAQFQERERFLNETYQDQIDKLKRSNQLLIQKRS